jgi:hypothetical protein
MACLFSPSKLDPYHNPRFVRLMMISHILPRLAMAGIATISTMTSNPCILGVGKTVMNNLPWFSMPISECK